MNEAAFTQTTASKLYQHEQKWGPFALSALIHALLFALLLYGIHWKSNSSDSPSGIEAELWSEVPTTLSKPAVLSQPALQSNKALKPEVVPHFSEQAADIALEREKQQRKEQLKQQQQQRRQQQQLAQQKAEQQKKLAEQQKKLRIKQQARTRAEQQHQARLMALQHLAASRNPVNNKSNGMAKTGSGETSGNGSAGYADKVRQHVKPNIIFDANSIDGNPQAVISVRCTPDGTILSASVAHSSGDLAWDEAVLRAVQKSDPMPRDADGKTPHRFMITFQPKN